MIAAISVRVSIEAKAARRQWPSLTWSTRIWGFLPNARLRLEPSARLNPQTLKPRMVCVGLRLRFDRTLVMGIKDSGLGFRVYWDSGSRRRGREGCEASRAWSFRFSSGCLGLYYGL